MKYTHKVKMTLEEKLNKEIEDKKNLLELSKKYPSLKEVKNRWGHIFYSAKEVNDIANEVAFVHSCGCCRDAVLYLMPYVVDSGVEIYSDPFQIIIGERYDFSYDILYENWEKDVVKYGLNEFAIEETKKYFKQQEALKEEYELNLESEI